MPGYTKEQLIAKGAKLAHYTWCARCRAYWHNSGFSKHSERGHPKVIVDFDMPKVPRPRKGDIAILHPAWEGMIDFLLRTALDAWKRDQAEGATMKPPTSDERSGPKGLRPTKGRRKTQPEVETLTVAEAVERLGVTRQEIMAEFDEIMRKHKEQKARDQKSPST